MLRHSFLRLKYTPVNQKIYQQTAKAMFEGRATPLQKAMIAEFLSQPENQELYFLWLEEWESQNPQLFADTDDAYLRLSQIVETATTPIPPTRPLSRRWFLLLGLAASVVLLLGTIGYYFRDHLQHERYVTNYGEVRNVTLSDGSQVTLNANSVLKVPRFGFKKNSREVFLTGEATFSVEHLPGHPRFIVRTPEQLEVEVLGTKFMVYSRARGSKVVLNEGKVQLRSLKKKTDQPLIIHPGDVATVSVQGNVSLAHNQPVAALASWKDQRFTFDNTPISEIAYQLDEIFGVQIIIADSTLARRTLGGTFKAETAEKFLQVIAEMLEVRVVPNAVPSQSPQSYTLTY
jgi:transmembrane sensor